MHGLINRSLQCFLQETYGPDLWRGVAEDAGVPAQGFEPMLQYDDALTESVLCAAASRLSKPRSALLEDLGTFLVSHSSVAQIRRLLRFGGDDFVQFLLSLDQLRDRARLAVPDLEIPSLSVSDAPPHGFAVSCQSGFDGAGHVIQGLLGAMADDYGALALFDLDRQRPGEDLIRVELLDERYAEGRSFSLSQAG